MFHRPDLVLAIPLAASLVLLAAAETTEGPARSSTNAPAIVSFREFRLATGRLFVPSGRVMPDGQVDLLVHFHGHPPVVCSNVLAADLSIPVVIVNFNGLSSA